MIFKMLKKESNQFYFRAWLLWISLSFVFAIVVVHDNGIINSSFMVKAPTVATALEASKYGLFLIDILVLGLIPFKVAPLLLAFLAASNISIFFLKSIIALLSGHIIGGVVGFLLVADTVMLSATYLLMANNLYASFRDYRQYRYELGYFTQWILAVKDTIYQFRVNFLITFVIYLLLLMLIK